MRDFKYPEAMQEIMGQIEQGALLVVKGKERMNVMTIGWGMFGVVWRRPMMMVAVRNSRYTYEIIEEADSFTVTVPTGPRKKEINFCGSKSGRQVDKFKECNLSTMDARKVTTPVLSIPGFHFECAIVYKTPMDPKSLSPDLWGIYPAKDYHTLYFGEIVASYQTE
ncbi:MAG TPA: flavin reductase family protein [Thermodesulfobacteriota bacterium]|nr:flavin reductase family protein [Thermodesulfobacteriota bacterium]